MSYRRRRGLGGGRGGRPAEPREAASPDDGPAQGGSAAEDERAGSDGTQDAAGPHGDEAVGAERREGSAAEATAPRAPTLSELFAPARRQETTARAGSPRRRWLVSLLAAIVFFGAGYLAAAQWVFPGARPADDSDLVQIPELVGLTEAEAQGRLERLGFEYVVRSGLTHQLAPEGAVLAQDPLPGQYARPGAPVYVSLSRGPEVHVLPNVSGLSERQAVIVLERLGYSVSVERRTHTLEPGRAIRIEPEAGTELAVPAEVRLIVSEGRPVVRVPDLLGRHVDDAAATLAGAGLDLGAITYDPLAREAPGRIVGQYPPPGYGLREGGRVEVRVAGDVERVDPTREWFERARPNP